MIKCDKCKSGVSLKFRWSINNQICPFCGSKIIVKKEYINIGHKIYNIIIRNNNKNDIINEIYDIIDELFRDFDKKINELKVLNSENSDESYIDEDKQLKEEYSIIDNNLDNNLDQLNNNVMDLDMLNNSSNDLKDDDIDMYISNNNKSSSIIEKRINIEKPNVFRVKLLGDKK